MGSNIDIIIIGIYGLSLLGVGFYASRKIKENMDFAIAGRNIRFPLLLGTLIGIYNPETATIRLIDISNLKGTN